jgi:hypothetical protein
MNSIVALPIAAAVPVASPSMAAADPKAEIARLEQAVDLLRTRHVCGGWKMDEVGAERALRYFRAGCPDDDDEWAATQSFISSHGLSLDWICDGNLAPMICKLASHSQQATATAVAHDPIFEAIEAHKAARVAAESILDVHTMLEKELPRERRRSDINVWEEKIVETDDPRWIECERAVMRAWEAEDNAAIDLVCIKPTTRAGFLALLDHAVDYDTDGHGWPRELQSDDGKRTRDWHQFLLENLVAGKVALGVDRPRV